MAQVRPRAAPRPRGLGEGGMTAWIKDLAGLVWLIGCVLFVFVAISVR